MSSEERPTYTFASSNHVMWAEEVARELDIPVEVVSAPSTAEAMCGLAIRTEPDRAPQLEAALSGEGITFRRLAD